MTGHGDAERYGEHDGAPAGDAASRGPVHDHAMTDSPTVASRHAHGGADEGSGAPGTHDGHSVTMFRSRFWWSLALTVPTLAFGPMLAHLLGAWAPRFPGSDWVPAMLGTVVFVYGGHPFLAGAWRELQRRQPGMMTLVALAISVAFAFSVAVVLGVPGMPLWEELATLVTIMLLGHWLEMRSVAQARGALGELAKLLPATATRVRVTAGAGEEREVVPLSAIRANDIVLVRPGENLPVDGEVQGGASQVNEAAITGESRPIDKRAGDRVIAGTTNGTGSLHVRVTGTGASTTLAGIMRLVSAAQSSRSRAQVLADRAAFWLTWVALGAGVLTLVAWSYAGAAPSYAIERVVTTLVVACPHALGLAIPLVVSISTTIGARSGLLVRDRRGLEEARLIDTVVFDKTGTLTSGEFGVVDITAATGLQANDILQAAASVEQDSEHAIARGIVATARRNLLAIHRSDGFEALPGHGVRAWVDGRRLAVGGPALIRELGVRLPEVLATSMATSAAAGRASVVLFEEGASGEPRDVRALGVLTIADVVRPESAEAVAALRAAGISVVMLTGDAIAVAQAVAQELGIDQVFAEVLPSEKADRIAELKSAGRRVAMVGDGVNDAPALLTANVGIAIGGGTDVAVEAGDIVLVRSDPRDVARIVQLSRATYRKMVQNLWWATGYNVLAIPLAAGVAAPWGLVLSPAIAAILMSASTLVVAANAQLLRRARL